MSNMRLHLGYLLGLFAVALAVSAGYISVVGWGKLFAGESTIVMIVMGIIEAAKVVTTIYLHRYGTKEPRPNGTNRVKYFFKNVFGLKTYLVIGVIATMFLTSVGIYGFLTGAYQDTANRMELQDGEISILEGKKEIFEVKILDNKDVIETKTKRINTLSDLRVQQEIRLDSLLINNHWTNAKKTQKQIEEANAEIQKLTTDIDGIVENNSALQDSVSVYQVKILELKGSSDIAAEIGPLKYISTLTGRPMDSIINWIVLVIIFIFDPMAIGLVIASNKVFDKNKKKGGEEPEDIPEELPDPDPTPETPDNHFKDDETGEIDLPEEPIEMSKDIWMGQGEDIVEPEPSGTTNEIIDEEDIVLEEEVVDINEPIDGEEIIEELTEDTGFPEEQIKENQQKIRDGIKMVEGIKQQMNKPQPVIPTGNVKREEIKEIKEGTRGYSVNVPEPKRVGSNKEVRNGNDKKFYFKRPK